METLYLVLFSFQVIEFVGLFLVLGSILVMGFLLVTSMKPLVVSFLTAVVLRFVEFSSSRATTATTSKAIIATNSIVTVAFTFGFIVSLSHGGFAIVMALLSRVTTMIGALITSLHVLLSLWCICSSYGSSSLGYNDD
jgi:hypothetical protein